MHFLIDANLPRSLVERIQRLGHSATDVRSAGLGDADDEAIAALAQRQGMTLPTRDFDFADVRNYPPARFHGIVVASFPSDTSALVLVTMIEAALRDAALLRELPGRRPRGRASSPPWLRLNEPDGPCTRIGPTSGLRPRTP